MDSPHHPCIGRRKNRKLISTGGEPVKQSRQLRLAPHKQNSRESGQTLILVLLVLGLFLLAFIALAVDYSNIWFHRQSAQGAADAACQAGAMDMYLAAQGAGLATANFTPGVNFDCATTPAAIPCQYALLNGYNGSGLTANESNHVAVTFPTSVDGVTTPPSSVAGPHPFMKVSITDRVKMFFSPLLTGSRTQDVGASAVCGLQEATSPIPIIVLNPDCPHAFEISGSAHLQIVGGPTKSVQVNSSNTTTACATAGSSSGTQCGSGSFLTSCPCPTCAVDLCQGGPDFTGSTFGTFGAAGSPSTDFSAGTTGSWDSPSLPISDPFATTNPPAAPAEVLTFAGGGYGYVTVGYHMDGCPDPAGCREYYPGRYTKPIVIKGFTAIFVPGIYYMDVTTPEHVNCGAPSSCSPSKPTGQCDAEFSLESNGLVRPADCSGGGCAADGASHPSGGTMFYFHGGGAAVNAGGSAGSGVDPYNTSKATCAGGTPPDSRLNLPATVTGNVLLGQCTNDGTYTTGASTGSIRGLLFFQNRAVSDLHKQLAYNGNGTLLLAGAIYAHNSTANADFIQFQGTPGNQTFILGLIVTDELVMSGNGSIAMALNPNAVYHILKVALLK